ncbi:hypothetical protein HETIRDRAFT_127172 [Heterobasidion irregulare TC 32-1]|uniref:Uncharacterized protein n=1 Tax=Heterobasidion irregulare (strain TC 32-1) TaxID=747525 RepID=W4JME3_HETIT|nr:uncharacterized protein HETIRDRAFT_127172 [Heterobasidion irregulare TC 32-1]ETW74722.1 hypothetical protein HETIRDRAFT_127172 [Heterobasidion irregulare TC 32-1]
MFDWCETSRAAAAILNSLMAGICVNIRGNRRVVRNGVEVETKRRIRDIGCRTPTPFSFGKLSLSGDIENMAGDDVVSKATRLTEKYPNAYSDFYGSATWVSIGTRICDELESVGIMWTSVNPLAYANTGEPKPQGWVVYEPKPFCPLITCVGVNPGSLLYEATVAAAAIVKNILTDAGFPDIEVAFIESAVTRFTGPKLLSSNPLIDSVPDLRKPFNTALGLSTAPRKYPYYEGTAALYFRLSKDDDRVVTLTCAHVSRPPHVYHNTGMTHKEGSQRREEIVALGTMGYDNGVKAMMATIGDCLHSIDAWNNVLRRLGDPVEGESENVTESRDEHLDLVTEATREIQRVKAIYSEAIENYTTLDQRTIGFVIHSEKIEVSVEPYKFTKDWALIELYNDKIDWTTFKGNKLWVGGKLSISEYRNTLFPQPQDRKNYSYLEDGLLQAYDIVREAKICSPQQPDVHGKNCLFVVKNGLTTGTTVGRVNGLESFRCIYEDYGISNKSLGIAVLPYDKMHGKFSDAGDSGLTNETDITYLTLYWWVEEQVKAKFPGCSLYEVVQ